MPKIDTIDFICQSCHCKLQVPAAMAGVSGPCPNCHSNITAPAKESEEAPRNTISLPPKRLPEHIPAAKIRAAAEAIRRSARMEKHGNASAASTELQFRQLSQELSTRTELEDKTVKFRKLSFLSLFVPAAFVAAAAAVALGVLHLADMINLLNYQNGFKKEAPVTEKVESPAENITVEVAMPESNRKEHPSEPLPEPTTNPSATNQGVLTSADPVPDTTQNKGDSKTITESEIKPQPKVSSSGQSKSPDTKPQVTKINPVMANLMQRGEFPELKLSPSAPKDKKNSSVKPTSSSSSTKPIVGYLARENLDAFLNAKTLDDRLLFILKEQRSMPSLAGSSLAMPFMPVKHVRLLETLSGQENDMVLHRYMLRFEDPSQPKKRLNMIVLLIERIGKHPPLIHAKAFVEHYNKALSEYAQKANPETATFHCIAEVRTSDFANELSREIKSSLVRFTIKSHPYYPTKFNAYLSKSSPLMSQIGSGKSFPYTTSKYAVLSFRWNTTGDKPYIELIDIINSDGWGG